jgi:DNA invertase Pin-like site-specific DNA recombinase
MTRVVGYVRIGPRERRSTRPELEAQRETIRKECERRGWTLVGFEEDIRSGRSGHRHGLDAALEACRSGAADGILVARLDRLTYSLEQLAQLVRDAFEGGFNLVAPDVGLDLGTPEGKHLALVLTTAVHWSPRGLGVRTRRALAEHRSVRQRGRPTSTPPAVAARIRALRDAGWTLQKICDALNAERVPTPRGGALWRPTSLRAVLRKPPAESKNSTSRRFER